MFARSIYLKKNSFHCERPASFTNAQQAFCTSMLKCISRAEKPAEYLLEELRTVVRPSACDTAEAGHLLWAELHDLSEKGVGGMR